MLGMAPGCRRGAVHDHGPILPVDTLRGVSAQAVTVTDAALRR